MVRWGYECWFMWVGNVRSEGKGEKMRGWRGVWRG